MKTCIFLFTLLLLFTADVFRPARADEAYTLPMLIDLARSGNPDIMAYEQRLQAATADIRKHKASFYPAISFNAAIQQTLKTSSRIEEDMVLGFFLDTKLLERKRLKNELSLAKFRYELTRYQALEAEINTALSVHQVYYNCLFHQEELKTLESFSKLSLKNLKDARLLVKAGRMTSYELHMVQLAWERSVIDIEKSRMDLKLSFQSLSVLINRNLVPETVLQGNLEFPFAEWTKHEMMELVLNRSGQLAIPDIENKIEELEVRMEFMDDISKLKFFAGYVYENEDNDGRARDDRKPYSGVLSASLDIPFDLSGKAKAGREKLLLVNMANAYARQTRESRISSEVSADFNRMQYLLHSGRMVEQELELAGKALDMIQVRIDNGRATALDYEETVQDIRKTKLEMFSQAMEYCNISSKYSVLKYIEYKDKN